MKIENRKSNKKFMMASLAIASIAILSLLSVYVFAFNGNFFGWQPLPQNQTSQEASDEDTTPDPEAPPSDEQIKDGESIKRDSIENENKEQPETTSLTITTARQASTGERLIIRTLIQRTTTQGSCSLTMSKDEERVTRTAILQALPNGSTCQGFDIPFSDLSPGVWTVKVDYTNGTDFATDTEKVEVS